MPGRDGTGPTGRGAMTGRALGVCIGANAVRCGAGRGLGLGYRRGSEKILLQEQKELLESRLAAINKQLESL